MESVHRELVALWNELQEINGDGSRILLDMRSIMDLMHDDEPMTDGSLRHDAVEGQLWRGLPLEARHYMPQMPAHIGPAEFDPSTPVPEPPREIAIEYRDARGRWAYLDAPGTGTERENESQGERAQDAAPETPEK